MAVVKDIVIDGKPVKFRASAAIPRIYRNKFRRDIFKDLTALEAAVDGAEPGKANLDLISLEVFENIAYTMAKHADPQNVPDSADEWLDQFNTFSIYEVLPQLIELWGINMEQEVESKKNAAALTAR